MEYLFFVAILPPPKITDEIEEIRNQCSLDHQVYTALKPPVHITLIPPFKLEKELETKLVSSLEQSRSFEPFEQQLQDYGSFPPRVVFINANKNTGILALHKILKEKLKLFLKDSPRSFHPHITIAYRDVEPLVYEQIMEAYSKRRFRETFTVDKFTLLRHDGQKWNRYKEFESKPGHDQYTLDI
jgi:2'-5' RNA ligase